MKIRINKKHLMQGVKFAYIMANKPDADKKIKFYYLENTFVLIDCYNDNKLYTFDAYTPFRKAVSAIIETW